MIKALALIAALSLAIPATPVFADSREDQLATICAGILDRQPRIVRKEAVQAIKPGAHVSIHPLCNGISLTTLGNAAGLGKTIGANPTLSRALRSHGWRADDVYGIVITGNYVSLYVHRD